MNRLFGAGKTAPIGATQQRQLVQVFGSPASRSNASGDFLTQIAADARYAGLGHTHTTSQVTGLDAALAGKQAASQNLSDLDSFLQVVGGGRGGYVQRAYGGWSVSPTITVADLTGVLPAANGGTGLNPSGSAANLRWDGSQYVLDSTAYATAASVPLSSSSLPSPLGTASAGLGTTWSRFDHVHAMPTASQVGALGATATAVDSSKLGGQNPSYYATALSLGNYVLKSGDAMTGGLSIGIGGASPYPTGATIPLSVATGTFSDIVTRSTSATAGASIAFLTASNGGSPWAIGKRDNGLSGMPVGAIGIWDDSTARWWMTSSLASYRVALETIDTLRYSGGIFRDYNPNTDYTAFYGAGTIPSSGNYGIAIRKDGAASYLNGTLSATLAVYGIPVLTATETGADLTGALTQGGSIRINVAGGFRGTGAVLTGSLSGTTAAFSGNLTAPSAVFSGNLTSQSATIGSSTAMLKRVAGALTDAVAGSDYLPWGAATGAIDLANINARIAGMYALEGASWSNSPTGLANGSSSLLLQTHSATTGIMHQILTNHHSSSDGNMWFRKSGSTSGIGGTWFKVYHDGNLTSQVVQSAISPYFWAGEALGGIGGGALAIGNAAVASASWGWALASTAGGVTYVNAKAGQSLYLTIGGNAVLAASSTTVSTTGTWSFSLIRPTEVGSLIPEAGAELGSLGDPWTSYLGNTTISGELDLPKIVVNTTEYTLPLVGTNKTIQIIFNVSACDVTSGPQSVSLRRDDGSIGSEASGTFIAASFGRTGSRMRSILLVGLSSTLASIIG